MCDFTHKIFQFVSNFQKHVSGVVLSAAAQGTPRFPILSDLIQKIPNYLYTIYSIKYYSIYKKK